MKKDPLEEFMAYINYQKKNQAPSIDKKTLEGMTSDGAFGNYLKSEILTPEEKIWYGVEAMTRISNASPWDKESPLTELYNYISKTNKAIENGKSIFDDADKKIIEKDYGDLADGIIEDLEADPGLYMKWRELRIKDYLKNINCNNYETLLKPKFKSMEKAKRDKYVLELGDIIGAYKAKRG